MDVPIEFDTFNGEAHIVKVVICGPKMVVGFVYFGGVGNVGPITLT